MERVWRVVSVNFVVGLLTLVVNFFRAVFEAIDRGIHAVDEGLRFREGEGRAAFAFKLVFGAGWFVFAYVFRFAWNLLVEPQINPVKHFPVVTVSHKILLPLVPSLAKQLGIAEKTDVDHRLRHPRHLRVPRLGVTGELEALPGERRRRGFGRSRWGRTARRSAGCCDRASTPAPCRRCSRKLRRAVRAGDDRRAAKCRHVLEHVAEDVERFAERNFLAYLRASARWDGEPVALGHPVLGPNRVALPIEVGADPGVGRGHPRRAARLGYRLGRGGRGTGGPAARTSGPRSRTPCSVCTSGPGFTSSGNRWRPYSARKRTGSTPSPRDW